VLLQQRPRIGVLSAPTGSAPNARASAWFLTALALIAIVVPILNLAVPPSSSFHLSAYALTLIGKYMCYAMLAMAVDLI